MNIVESARARWAALDARERRMVVLAGTLAGVALLWWLALAPALRTLAAAPAEHARLDAQMQQMASLQQRAKALQSQPRLSRDDAMRSLESSVREGLGANSSQLVNAATGDGATVNLRQVPAATLAQWITQARGNAHAVPREVHLSRAAVSPTTPAAPTATATVAGIRNTPAAPLAPQVRWDGNLTLSLPAER